nr:MAG TPA: PolyVal ADP-Ribosyltransferase [Caudoviricetes sp.]
MAKKKKTTSQKNYSAQDYLNMARDAEKKTQRETELRESRTATDYLNMARQAQGEQPIPKRKKEDDQEKGNAGEKLNRAALLMSRIPGAGDLKRQELNRTARALQQAAARSYKSDGKNWSLAGTGSVFDPIGTTAKRREFESGLDTELLQSNLNRLTEQEKREQSAQKEQNAKKNASSLHQRTQPKEWMMPVKREFGSRVGSGVETFGGGGGKIDAQKEPETAREALFGESLTDRKARVQNALYEAASAADRAQRSAFDRKGAQERLAEIAGLKQTDEQQREADYLDMAEGDDTAWLSPAEMQALKEKNGTYGEKYAQEERALNRGLNRSERYVYEEAMNVGGSFDRLAEEGRAMDTRMKNAEDVLAYPHDAKAAAEAEKLVKYTTDAERKTYYYTLRTKGQEAADAYLDALDADLNRRRGEAQLEATRQTVNSGALGAIGANAYSVLSSVGETPAYISNLIQFLRGQDIDPYSPENMVSRVNEEIRSQTTQNIENGAPGFLGKALGFGYGVGMDLARSRYNMMLGLGLGGNSRIGKWTSSALMGVSSAQSTLTDALDRGATDEQAIAASIASGIWETLFEEVSLERLLDLKSPKTVRQFLTNTLLQSATEGSEELFTEMANTLTDELIMKDLSNYRLNKKAYEASGLTEEEARRNAMADVAKNWGMAALGGFASGAVGAGVHQGIAYGQNRRNERFQNTINAYENNRQQQASPQTVQEAASAAAQNDRLNNSEQNITKTQQMNGETNGTARQTAARDGSVQAAYEGGGTNENVEIDQQNPVSRVEKGTVYLRTADGSDVRASDVTFGDERDNLLAAEGVGRMSPAGITGMLNNYDGTKATAKEYASAYLSVYNRARAGMTVQQAVYDSAQTRSALTEEAAMAAYAAGEKMNMGRIVPMTRAEKQRQQAQLDLVGAINEKFSKSGVKIEMVDRIEGYGGQEANGRWDSETNTIYVSKNADDHAYAYIAMHELTHAMKSRNASEFEEFGNWVVYYLNENGQDADALVRGEMIAQAQAMGLMERQKANLTTEEQLKLLDGLSEEQYKQLNELAQEELICNTVPSILQNENVLMDLYHTKPTLFERIKNFLKEFIDAVRGTGRELGKTRAFQQMEAMGKNQAALEDIYNRMVQMAENGAQEKQREDGLIRYSPKSEESMSIKEQIRKHLQEINERGIIKEVQVDTTKAANKREMRQEMMDYFSQFGYKVERAKFGTVEIDKKQFNKGMNYVKTTEEYAAMKAIPYVIKQGIDISGHEDHKGRGFSTITFAAQVKLNGTVGDMGVVVKKTGSYKYKAHRILMPDGSAFSFDQTENADNWTDVGKLPNGNGMTSTASASEDNISDLEQNVNEKFSMKEDSDFEYDEDSNLTREQQRQVATPEFKRWFMDSKVVDEEGKPLVVYHGTDAEFNVFDMSKGRANMDIQGAFFSPYELDAQGYGENVGAYYLSIQNPADEGTAYKALNRFKGQNNAGIKAREYLQKQGYDGVYNGYDEYIAFEPTQIKSATDNVGTFDPFNPDVRYSLKETDEDVRKQVDLTRELMEETGGYRLTQEDAERVMKRVAKEFGSQTDANELAADFARVMEYARQQNADMDQVDNELLSIADKMIANSQQLDEEHEEEVKPIREKLRKTAISLTDSQKAEAASMTGSLGAYRKALFGQVRMSQQSGVSLDSVWSELSDLSPTLFPADTAEGDMPRLLMEAADAVKPIIENQYGLDSEEAAQYAVMQMVDQYMKLPGVQKTARDQKRMGLTADQYRELMDAFLQKSEKQFQSAWVKTWMQKEKVIGAQKEQEARAKYQEWKRKQTQRNQEWRKEELQSAKAWKQEKRQEMSLWRQEQRSAMQESAKEWKQEKRQEMSLWRQEQRNAMQEKYRQWRQTDTETRRNREAVNTYRDRLERTTRTLLNWMEKPNKTQHVPMELQSNVQKVLTGLDFSGKTTLAAKDLGSRIEAMTNRIANLQEKTDENGASSQTFYLERDQQMLDELHHLAAVIGANNGNVYELSAEELRDLNKWMNAVKHVITDVNKNHAKYYQGKYYQGESQYGTIEEVADSTKAELHQKKAYADKKGVTRAWNEMLGKGMVDCFSFFDKMGSAGGEVFGNLRKGFDKHIRNVSAAKGYTESLLKGVDQKTLREWTNKKKRTEYTTDRGETIRLNTAEVMELYVLSQREQAQSHLYGQGIRTNEKVEPVMLTRGDVQNITGTLTKEQKQIADRMQKFLAKDCAAWGNEASRVLVGYDKFGEEHYWPIRTDPNSNRTLNADGSAANLSYIKNQSFTKELTEKAQNAIMVESIFGTYTRHISQMSAYNAYAVAMTDLQRWFNTPGVKTEIERAYGSNGVRYITDLMKQINGTADNGKTFGGVPKLVSHAKAAAVGANLSVAIQQPTAYVRAADMISPKYLREGLFQKSEPELVKKWCPIAEWKSWGFYETDVGRGLNDLIVDQSNALERATEKSMILAEKGDEWTWGKLWNAVAAETRDLYAGELEPGTDAFYEKVGQRLSEIIDKTQVVDSVFHRSPIMRDRGYSSIFTSFMSESIKTYNMVERAIANFAENRKDPTAKRRLMRTMAVYVVNALAGAMAKSIPAAARDDDKEKNYWEKYLEALVENGKENLLFTNNIPMIKDWLAVLNGEETKRLEYQSIERLASLLAEMYKAVWTGKGSKWSGFKWFYRIAQSASDITGVPAYAAIRDAKAIVQTVGSAIGQDWYIPMENETASFSYAAENLYEAIRKGDSTAETRLREKLGATKSPAQIDAAVANVLMQQDSRVAEAAALKLQGKATELNQKKQEMVADGFTAEMVDKAVNRYITEGQAEKEKDLTKELKANLWSKEEAVTALRTAAGLTEGSATADDVKAIVSELVADSTAKDPAKTVKNGIISEVKKDYVSLMEEGKTTEAKTLLRVMQDTLGVTDADAKGWVTEGHQESLRTAAEAMDVRALKAAMTKLKKDGKTDQSMKSSIEGVLKKQYTAAKEAGDRGQMEKIIRFLTGLDLKNAKGEKYFTREKIQAWGE